MANKKISDFTSTPDLLDDDNLLIDRPSILDYVRMTGSTFKTFIGVMVNSFILTKVNKLYPDTQQIPLIDNGDGFITAIQTAGTSATLRGDIYIVSNNLTETIKLAQDQYIYFEAQGLVFAYQLSAGTLLKPALSGVVVQKKSIYRVVSTSDFNEQPGLTTAIFMNGQSYEFQKTFSADITFGFNAQYTDVVNGTDESYDTSPFITKNGDDIDINSRKMINCGMGQNSYDVATMDNIFEVDLREKSVMLSTPRVPPFMITRVWILNKGGSITCQVNDAVSFVLPVSGGGTFNGTVSQIDGLNIEVAFTGYNELDGNDAGSYSNIKVNVGGIGYNVSGYYINIETQYVPDYTGNGDNQLGNLGNYNTVDALAQISFVLNSIKRIGTKIKSQIIAPLDTMSKKVQLNRSLTNTEGLETAVWYCYDKVSGDEIIPTLITGSGYAYTLTFGVTADRVDIVFLGENLPFTIPTV